MWHSKSLSVFVRWSGGWIANSRVVMEFTVCRKIEMEALRKGVMRNASEMERISTVLESISRRFKLENKVRLFTFSRMIRV